MIFHAHSISDSIFKTLFLKCKKTDSKQRFLIFFPMSTHFTSLNNFLIFIVIFDYLINMKYITETLPMDSYNAANDN